MSDHIPRQPMMNAIASHYENSCDHPKNALSLLTIKKKNRDMIEIWRIIIFMMFPAALSRLS